MDDIGGRKVWFLGGLLVVGAILVGLVFMGGQVSKVLSTVGNAIPDQPQTGTTGDVGGSGSGTGTGAQPTAGGGSGSGTDGQVAGTAATVPTLLIIRTGSLALEVGDLDVARRGGDAAVDRAGGYVSGSSRTAAGVDAAADATYRIPSAAWDATLAALHGLASKVLAEDIKTDEVSSQVIDLAARIANLRATEAALQAIMVKATRISDVLDVQKQLTATRGDIERLVADKAHLEDQAAFGSLTVTYRLPPVPAPVATVRPVAGWNPAEDAARATDQLVRIGQKATTAGIWVGIVGLPSLLAFGLGVLVLRLGWLAVRRVARLALREPA